jgi:hypothetical protein
VTVNQRATRAHQRPNGPAAAVTSHVSGPRTTPKHECSPLSLDLPPGFERAKTPTAPDEPAGRLDPDEIRIRRLMTAAVRKWGWLAR